MRSWCLRCGGTVGRRPAHRRGALGPHLAGARHAGGVAPGLAPDREPGGGDAGDRPRVGERGDRPGRRAVVEAPVVDDAARCGTARPRITGAWAPARGRAATATAPAARSRSSSQRRGVVEHDRHLVEVGVEERVVLARDAGRPALGPDRRAPGRTRSAGMRSRPPSRTRPSLTRPLPQQLRPRGRPAPRARPAVSGRSRPAGRSAARARDEVGREAPAAPRGPAVSRSPRRRLSERGRSRRASRVSAVMVSAGQATAAAGQPRATQDDEQERARHGPHFTTGP